MRSTPLALALGFVAAAVIVVATFLPWQETPLNGEVSGISSGGWAPAILALIAGFNLLAWKTTGKVRDAWVAAACGAFAAIASGYLIYDFSTRTEGLFEESSTSDPRIGGYVALVGALVLMASALMLARSAPTAAALRGDGPPPPPPPPR